MFGGGGEWVWKCWEEGWGIGVGGGMEWEG